MFHDQLLARKFFIPTSSHTLIPRPRLIELLNRSLACPLTLASAKRLCSRPGYSRSQQSVRGSPGYPWMRETWPDPNTPFEETASALAQLVQEGKIRYVGVSNYNVEQMKAFEKTRKLDALQPPYSLFRRDIEQAILPYTQQHGIGVLVYGPLAHGLLAGAFTSQTTFAPDDWRSKSEIFRGEIFQRNLAVVEQLKRLAEREGMTVAQLAIAWVLAQPAVDVAIVGARTPQQLAQIAPASDIHLTQATLQEIERIMREAVPIGGPAPEGM